MLNLVCNSLACEKNGFSLHGFVFGWLRGAKWCQTLLVLIVFDIFDILCFTRAKKNFSKIKIYWRIIIPDVICLQNLQKFFKNLHPVSRYSPSKWMHFSCQNQLLRYNSVYGSRLLWSMFCLNLVNPCAHSPKKSSFRLPWFYRYSVPKRPPKNKHLR